MSTHRRATSPRLSARGGLAFATAAVLGGGVLGGVTLAAQPTATAAAAPLVVSDSRPAAPALPSATATRSPLEPSSAPTTHRQQAKPPTTTTTHKARSKAKAVEATFCDKNPDRCTGGVPDKKSDRAEYQNDPRSNAEINSDMPLYAPEGLCPDGHARIAGVC